MLTLDMNHSNGELYPEDPHVVQPLGHSFNTDIKAQDCTYR